MAKQILFENDAKKSIIKGMTNAVKALGINLGPTGKYVLMSNNAQKPTIPTSGYDLLREFELKNPFENMGVKILNEAASKLHDKLGDGTTTAAILTYSLVKEIFKCNEDEVRKSKEIVDGMHKAVEGIINEINKKSVKIDTKGALSNIIKNQINDKYISSLLADVIYKLGPDAIINVEKGQGSETNVQYFNGMKIDKGFISPYFVNNIDNLNCELNDALVLIYDKKLSSLADIVPVMELAAKNAKPLFIIAEDVDADALKALIINKLQNGFNCCAIKSPAFGERKKAILQDIAILTSGKYFSSDMGDDISKITLKDLGTAKKVVVDKDNTIIIGKNSKSNALIKRIKQIEKEIERTDSNYDKDKLNERLAGLTGNTAIITVGGKSEENISVNTEKIKSIVDLSKSILKNGGVPGGGTSFIKSRRIINKLEFDNQYQKKGAEIVYKALESPSQWLLSNNYLKPSVIINEINKAKDFNLGYNMISNKICDLIEGGIVDSPEILSFTLRISLDIASNMVSSNALITKLDDVDELAHDDAVS